MNRSYILCIKREGIVILLAFVLLTQPAKGDLSTLGVIGPQSGSGFSNLGALSKEPVTTSMTKADVLIELQKREGDDLTATCTAVFELDTAPGPSSVGQKVLVAFPVTGFGGEAVKISQFEVIVDGVGKPDLRESRIRLFNGESVPFAYKDWTAVDANPDTFEFFGFKAYGENALATDTLLTAYAWTQEFLPGGHCVVQVKYALTLHAQSLAYAKRYVHGYSQNVVPFDAMLVGPTDRKGFFLDYILRSGGTWKGPIGHETVTLRAADASGIILPVEEIVTLGRHVFAFSKDDIRDSVSRHSAGLDAIGVRRSNGIVWEIDHEKPQQDILVEIPEWVDMGKGPSMTPAR